MSQPNLVNPSKREVLNKREYPDMKCRIRRSCQIGARSPTTTRSRALINPLPPCRFVATRLYAGNLQQSRAIIVLY